jgi:hypothetical protein
VVQLRGPKKTTDLYIFLIFTFINDVGAVTVDKTDRLMFASFRDFSARDPFARETELNNKLSADHKLPAKI